MENKKDALEKLHFKHYRELSGIFYSNKDIDIYFNDDSVSIISIKPIPYEVLVAILEVHKHIQENLKDFTVCITNFDTDETREIEIKAYDHSDAWEKGLHHLEGRCHITKIKPTLKEEQ